MYVSMKGMLERANKGNYAVMAINCFNIETTRAVIEAAQSLRAPIIINIVQEHMENHCDSELIAPIVRLLAQRASVEVALIGSGAAPHSKSASSSLNIQSPLIMV